MAIRIPIDSDVPLPPRKSRQALEDHLPQRVRAFANTARQLAEEGLNLTPTGSDERVAADIVAAFAADPEKAAKEVSEKELSNLTPASLVQADAILTEFGKQVVHSTAALRHTITNKLLLETDNADPRVRLKALELLGKISDVGLFAEKSEITITHKTSDELRDALREKLNRLREEPVPKMQPVEDITDAEFEEVFSLDDLDTPEEVEEDDASIADIKEAVSKFDDYDD